MTYKTSIVYGAISWSDYSATRIPGDGGYANKVQVERVKRG
jgi:hypothetical protein